MSFRKAYIEPSVINRAQKCGLSGLKLKEMIEKHSFAPAVGLQAIYEMARTFLNQDDLQLGTALFQIIWELDPYYQMDAAMLHDQEIIKLRTGAAVFSSLAPINLTATRLIVGRLARGFLDDGYMNFIAVREAEIRENHPNFALGYIEETKGTTSKRFPTFESFYIELADQIPDLIYQSVKGKVTISEAHEIYHRIGSFPAIRSTVRSNIYLCWICVNHQNIPKKDKYDDYRHIIEASYCDIFVTDDKQLSNTAPRINPDIEVLKGRQFF